MCTADVTITDGASVKGSVRDDVLAVYGEWPSQVVLGHPIAGSEKAASKLLTPRCTPAIGSFSPRTAVATIHLARMRAMWQAVGAEVITMDVDDHDVVLAATSHLPHVIAFSLVDTLAHDSQQRQYFSLRRRWFSRLYPYCVQRCGHVADIMLANKPAVLTPSIYLAIISKTSGRPSNSKMPMPLPVYSRALSPRAIVLPEC